LDAWGPLNRAEYAPFLSPDQQTRFGMQQWTTIISKRLNLVIFIKCMVLDTDYEVEHDIVPMIKKRTLKAAGKGFTVRE